MLQLAVQFRAFALFQSRICYFTDYTACRVNMAPPTYKRHQWHWWNPSCASWWTSEEILMKGQQGPALKSGIDTEMAFCLLSRLPQMGRGNAHGAYVPVVLTAGGGAPWQRPDFTQQYCLLSTVPADHSSALQKWQVCQCGRGRPSSPAADSFIRVVIKTTRADAQPHSSC
ncbi:hypothetical protein QQF64_008605 [Cirrhinus molitorella]|uniref:Uncharacterized protein n=1 Tax=Cirrhinus molitorella TaxID=172907 RepID=A0ABR3MAR5_9TELE